MKIIHVFYFIFVSLGIFIPGSVIMNMFQERDKEGKVKGAEGFLQAAGAGIVGGLFAATLPNIADAALANPGLAWFSALILLTVLGAFVGLALLWKEEGSKIGELICALILVIFFTILGFQAAHAVSVAVPSAFGQSVIKWLVRVAAVACSGYIICNWCFFRYKVSEKVGWRIAGIIVMVLTILNLIGSIFTINWLGIKELEWDRDLDWFDDSSIAAADDSEYEDEFIYDDDSEYEEDEYWYAFFNPSLQYDEDETNDFNFGYNPYDYDEDITKDAAWFDKDFRSRFAIDPALLAADAAYLDSIVGTRYIGVFYEGAKEDWAQAINDAKVAWMNDKMLYFESVDAFNAFLDSAVKVEVLESNGKETDMMYMNPYTIDGVPDVIVMKTDDHKGHYLVYTFQIKGQEFRVAYRIECGYQPVNVSSVMNIKPVPEPGPKPSGTGGGGGSQKTYYKDKTKGTQGELVNPNDNKGAGKDTNAGVDATESKAEEHPNSTDAKSYEEYKETVQELKDINDSQKTDKDTNNPTVVVPKNTKVDNNGAKTVDVDKASDAHAQDGTNIADDKDNPAGEWGGPKD